MATQFTRAPAIRLLGIGVLGMLMLIPLLLVDGVVDERRDYQHQAQSNIAKRWGESQIVGAPLLIRTVSRPVEHERGHRMQRVDHVLLPDRATTNAELSVEWRQYGIYSLPVYVANISIHGEFAGRLLAEAALDPEASDWALFLPISDLRGMRSVDQWQMSGRDLEFSSDQKLGTNGLIAKVSNMSESGAEFSVQLSLAGSREISFLPLAETTDVKLLGNWSDPSYDGAFLPLDHQSSDEAFVANWRVLSLSRGFPQQWIGDNHWYAALNTAFGARLHVAVDVYRVTERAIKYAILFMALTFLGYFIVEATGKDVTLHPFHYGLIGLGLSLFYLLFLALSEYLGIGLAYLIAAGALVLLIGGYSRAILGSPRRGNLAACGLITIYALLYGLIVAEHHSLLVGSLALLVTLAIAMYVTRDVDWSGLSGRSKQH